MSHPNKENFNFQSVASSSCDLEGELFEELSEDAIDKFNGGSVLNRGSSTEKSKGMESRQSRSPNAEGWRFVN